MCSKFTIIINSQVAQGAQIGPPTGAIQGIDYQPLPASRTQTARPAPYNNNPNNTNTISRANSMASNKNGWTNVPQDILPPPQSNHMGKHQNVWKSAKDGNPDPTSSSSLFSNPGPNSGNSAASSSDNLGMVIENDEWGSGTNAANGTGNKSQSDADWWSEAFSEITAGLNNANGKSSSSNSQNIIPQTQHEWNKWANEAEKDDDIWPKHRIDKHGRLDVTIKADLSRPGKTLPLTKAKSSDTFNFGQLAKNALDGAPTNAIIPSLNRSTSAASIASSMSAGTIYAPNPKNKDNAMKLDYMSVLKTPQNSGPNSSNASEDGGDKTSTNENNSSNDIWFNNAAQYSETNNVRAQSSTANGGHKTPTATPTTACGETSFGMNNSPEKTLNIGGLEPILENAPLMNGEQSKQLSEGSTRAGDATTNNLEFGGNTTSKNMHNNGSNSGNACPMEVCEGEISNASKSTNDT